ncbi:4158_t:CDS:2 [Funneliformis geosporum]|uniref:4158_t:CDS:1 n=1 Tax=Funneliformis geosporum TaxID=1117311 RepID=A0A9W4SNL3_9GLOM|nr:4158_t:CDS:2 [Funneliformis geosporum]
MENNKPLDKFASQMLDSAIQGINQAAAAKQKEINYWKDKVQARLTNQQLLRILGERIAREEINFLNPYLFVEKKGQKTVLISLKDGQTKFALKSLAKRLEFATGKATPELVMRLITFILLAE